jgi:hypothetical protein
MFLYKREKALSPQLCEDFIKTFETSDRQFPGVLYGSGGLTSEGGKKSTDITFDPLDLKDNTWGPLLNQLIPIIDENKNNYIERYNVGLNGIREFEISVNFNMQRYLPNEGFSLFHCERASLKHADRVLVWMIYLNDVYDKGETQFYYQNHFEKPKQGNLLIWPSDWMYIHRGISSPTETKYILTGWFTYV